MPGNPHILVVDDTPDIIVITQAILQSLGATTTSASSGDAALRITSEAEERGKPFDMIILDIHMPGMNGNELAEKLRSSGYTGSLVVFTANATMEGKKKIKSFGIDAYLSKTQLNKDVLSALVSTHCNKAK